MSSVVASARPLDEVKAVRAAQASRITGLSERTIWRLCASGQLRTIKIGRATVIPISSIDELLQGGGDVATT